MEPTAENNPIQTIGAPLYQAKGWMKFVGVLSILYGIMVALSIIGLLIAWLPIWIGVLLFQSASAVDEAQQKGDQAALIRSLEKLRTYFTIVGILGLIGLILGIIGMVTGIAGGLAGLGEMQGLD